MKIDDGDELKIYACAPRIADNSQHFCVIYIEGVLEDERIFGANDCQAFQLAFGLIAEFVRPGNPRLAELAMVSDDGATDHRIEFTLE